MQKQKKQIDYQKKKKSTKYKDMVIALVALIKYNLQIPKRMCA